MFDAAIFLIRINGVHLKKSPAGALVACVLGELLTDIAQKGAKLK